MTLDARERAIYLGVFLVLAVDCKCDGRNPALTMTFRH